MKLSNSQGWIIYILISVITYCILYYFGWKDPGQELCWTSVIVNRISILPAAYFMLWWWIKSLK